MTDVVVIEGEDTLIVSDLSTDVVEVVEETIVVTTETSVDVITDAEQGPRGIQGIPGPAGGATAVTVGASPISGHSAVAMDENGLLVYADCSNPSHIGAILGIVGNSYSPGDSAVVQTDFDLSHSGWSFSPGPVFVGIGGALVQALPVGAVFAQVIAYALTATRIRVDLQPPIVTT